MRTSRGSATRFGLKPKVRRSERGAALPSTRTVVVSYASCGARLARSATETPPEVSGSRARGPRRRPPAPGPRVGAAPGGGVGLPEEVGPDRAEYPLVVRDRAERRADRVEQVPAEIHEGAAAGEDAAGEPAPPASGTPLARTHVALPAYSAPCACAASWTSGTPLSAESLASASMPHIWPAMWTGMIAAVRGVIAAAAADVRERHHRRAGMRQLRPLLLPRPRLPELLRPLAGRREGHGHRAPRRSRT
ncbi:predicted protein [Streptomyces sp. SPB78]|nr:predicted protein [Streptomyces sp. SPB78]